MKHRIIFALGVIIILILVILFRKAPEQAAACCAITEIKAEVLREINYKNIANKFLKLDIYQPKRITDKRIPLVIYIHGGGWTAGNKNGVEKGYNPYIINRLVNLGYAVASIDYRLTNIDSVHFPAPVEDCKDAIRWLRKNADVYGFDPDSFGLIGESAGAHLAMLCAYSKETDFVANGLLANYSARVNYVVDIFGPTDLNKLFRSGVSDFLVSLYKTFKPQLYNLRQSKIQESFGIDALVNRDNLIRYGVKYSPLTYVRKGGVPTLIFHGDLDKVVPLEQSQELSSELAGAGFFQKLHIYKGADHAFHHLAPADLADMTNQIADFIRRQQAE